MRIIRNSRRSNSVTINKKIDSTSKINSLIPDLLSAFKSLKLKNPECRIKDKDLGLVRVTLEGDAGKVYDVKSDLINSIAKCGFKFVNYDDRDTGRGMETEVDCIYMDQTPISNENPFNKVIFGDLNFIREITGFPVSPEMAVSVIEDAIKTGKSFKVLIDEYRDKVKKEYGSQVGYLKACAEILNLLEQN